MAKTRAELIAMAHRGGQATKTKYAGTGYFSALAAMGGRAGKGVSKPRKNPGDRPAVDAAEKELPPSEPRGPSAAPEIGLCVSTTTPAVGREAGGLLGHLDAIIADLEGK